MSPFKKIKSTALRTHACTWYHLSYRKNFDHSNVLTRQNGTPYVSKVHSEVIPETRICKTLTNLLLALKWRGFGRVFLIDFLYSIEEIVILQSLFSL